MTGQIAGLILAGGQSRRMGGRDKAMLTLGSQRLIDRVAAWIAPQVDHLVLNANGDTSRFGDLELPIISDAVEGFAGPLAGILAGLTWARQQAGGNITHVVSVAADTPFFPTDLVERFLQAVEGGVPDSIAIARTGGRLHPVFGLWPVHLADQLEQFLREEETRKVLAFVDRFTLVETSFDDGAAPGSLDPFFNINKVEDLEVAEHYIRNADHA